MRRLSGFNGREVQLALDDLDRRIRKFEYDDGHQEIPTSAARQPNEGARLWYDEQSNEIRVADRGGSWSAPLYPGYTDVVFPGGSLRAGVTAPGPVTNWLTDQTVWQFTVAQKGTEYLNVQGLQLPHGYVAGSDLYWHVHFTTPDAITDASTVIFALSYTLSSVWGTFPAVATATATFTNNAATRQGIIKSNPGAVSGTTIAANTHLIAGGSGGTISGTGVTLSAVLNGKITRPSGAGTDTHNGDAYMLSADAHIKIDRWGSKYEYHD